MKIFAIILFTALISVLLTIAFYPPCPTNPGSNCCSFPVTPTPKQCKTMELIAAPSNIALLTDAEAKAKFTNYLNTTGVTDAVGFSINRDLIIESMKRITDNPTTVMGVRFYPGADASTKGTLIINIDAIGKEISGSAGSNTFNPTPINIGPCPTWCDQAFRIIKND